MICDCILTFLANSNSILQISNAKTFKTRYKLWSEMNRTWVSHKILLMKSSGNHFVFLPVFYLKASKNFGKIAILKIWELISFAEFLNIASDSPESTKQISSLVLSGQSYEHNHTMVFLYFYFLLLIWDYYLKVS